MEPINRELFRQALLRVLDANNTRHGLGLPALALLVNQYGFTPRGQETDTEIRYLQDKSLVEPVSKLVSPENRTYRITAAGRDYLAEQA